MQYSTMRTTNFPGTLSRIFTFTIFLLVGLFALQTKPAYALNTCYAVADTGNSLVSLDKISGKVTYIGSTGRDEIEAAAFKPNSEVLYVTDKGELGTLSLITGTFTAIGIMGSGDGSQGVQTFNDVDGLSWDSTSGTIYAVLRHDGPDLLFQIDPASGAHVAGAFNGNDYVEIAPTAAEEDNVDDISFDPTSGALYGLANKGGTGGTLIIINKATGAITEVAQLIETANGNNVVDDMEGLSFFNDGALYGSTGDSGPDEQDHNKLYQINKETGGTTFVADFVNGNSDLTVSSMFRTTQAIYNESAINRLSDFEGLACLTASIADDDGDGMVNSGEDTNGNGNLQDDDTDGDGTPNYVDNDDDGDLVLTLHEDPNHDNNAINDDSDNDGIPNYLDNDDDQDGTSTKDEDSDGNKDPRNDDADSDSIADYLEPDNVDLDKDGLVNQLDNDDDGDGIPSKTEGDGDEDNDQKPNYIDLNADGDTFSDKMEWSTDNGDPLDGCTSTAALCFNNDVDGDTVANFLDKDADNDGLPDELELPGDMNGDGIPNWLDVKSGLLTVYLPLINKQ